MKTTAPRLPHASDFAFLTDGGLETTLVFNHRLDLPCFAAFPLLGDPAGRATLRRYYEAYARLAARFGAGFVLESPGWRGNPDWAEKLGYSPARLDEANRDGIRLMHEILAAHETPASPMLISGNVGPRGDGYLAGARMRPDEAASYHARQIGVYRDAGADFVSAFTLTYPEEALGIADAAAGADIPAVISFTVETDGRLPTGEPLREAIEHVDALADTRPAYYMINCAHPHHFVAEVAGSEPWLSRIGGLRANASRRSHAELDEATDLDAGNPRELGDAYRGLRAMLPNLRVLGGCCGTDLRHLEAIAEACLRPAAAAA